MSTLMRGRTSFVIAHRLSTIRDADTILVMDHGRIVEQGTHETLLARRGFYFDLYDSQFAEPLEQAVEGGLVGHGAPQDGGAVPRVGDRQPTQRRAPSRVEASSDADLVVRAHPRTVRTDLVSPHHTMW